MRSPERIVAVVFVCLVAALLRGGYVATTVIKSPLRADAGQYAQYAENLVEHGVFSLDTNDPPTPDSFRSPGFPALLAAVRWVAGPDSWHEAIKWVQVVLGTLTVLMAFLFGQRCLGYGAGLTVAVLTALSPHLVTSTSYVLTETLTSFTLVGAMLAFAHRRWAFAGLLFGLTALVNEVFVLLPVGLAFLTASKRHAAVFMIAFVCVAAPWAARNQIAVEDPALSGSRRALRTLTHGTYPNWVHDDPAKRFYPYHTDPAQPAYGESWGNFVDVFSERFAERPGRHLSWYLFEKPYWLWSWSILQGQGDVYVYPVAESLYLQQPVADGTRLLMKWLHPVAVLAGLLGAVLALRRTRDPDCPVGVRAAAWMALYATGVYIVFAPWPRYAVPLRPELYLLATFAVVQALRRPAPAEATAAEPAPAC